MLSDQCVSFMSSFNFSASSDILLVLGFVCALIISVLDVKIALSIYNCISISIIQGIQIILPHPELNSVMSILKIISDQA